MSDFDDRVLFTQAQIVTRANGRSDLLKLAKSRALDPAVFDQYPPFIWQSEISSDRLDAYYTVMDAATTLPNYASDAEAGVAVLIGHDSRAAPTGYSLSGTLEQGTAMRVLSDAYALSDDATAPMINKLRAGVIRDVSVGFSTRGAQCTCSICGRDMWRDYRCWHIPGIKYKRTDNPEDAVSDPNGELAIGTITNAHLAEYSLVFDGATPGAAVIQAQRAAAAGRLNVQQARLIEQRYRINLPGKRITTQGVSMGTENGNGGQVLGNDERELQTILERAGVPSDRTGLDRIRWMADELTRLRPLAEDGRTYRADLVDAGVVQAVRAFGAEAGEKKRAMLERLDLETIQETTAGWQAIGDSKLPGGRQSTDEGDPPLLGGWQPRTPDMV